MKTDKDSAGQNEKDINIDDWALNHINTQKGYTHGVICVWKSIKRLLISRNHIFPCYISGLKYTPSRRSAVGQFLFVGRLNFLSVSAPSAEVGPCRLFFGRFDILNQRWSSSVSRAIWSFWLAVQLANQCTRKAQNRCATWLSGVERRLGVSGQLWTQTLPTWADPAVCFRHH